MVFEHKMIVGLEEIRSVIFECNECKSRTSIIPEKIGAIPRQCPNAHKWNEGIRTKDSVDSTSPFMEFIDLLNVLRRSEVNEQSGFTVFFEYEEPRNENSRNAI